MTDKQKQQLITDLLFEIECKENEFPVVPCLSVLPKRFYGLVVQVSDHGNITAYRVFKNGNARELASRV
jgi:hypothetical protein